jgi:hypothetical protein
MDALHKKRAEAILATCALNEVTHAFTVLDVDRTKM